MKTISKASIVIPTYNRADYLDLTLKSIKSQRTTETEIETIVVDDGSTDHTADVVRKYERLINLKYFFQEDLGNRTAAARNLGISEAEGEIVIFVDSGVILNSHCIQEHILIHAKSNEEVAVIGYVYGFDQYCADIQDLIPVINIDDIDGSIATLRNLGKFRDMREKVYESRDYQINEMPAPWAMFITCNCSVARSALNKVGYFDINLDFNWGVEDLELGYRLWKSGIKFIVGKKAMSIHYPHDADFGEKFKEEKINKEYFHRKHNSRATEIFLTCGFLELNDKIIDNN